MIRSLLSLLLVFLAPSAAPAARHSEPYVRLPPGVRAVWDLAGAYRERTQTRERICLNGLWRWQPADATASAVPHGGWGYFKVPGCWPGITDYMQKDCQTVFRNASWKNANLGAITSAWYEREITVPADWRGRRIAVKAEYLNSLAWVFIDGKKAGEMRFPAGEVDLTSVCRPGSRHRVSLLVTAAPLKAVMLSYTDTNAAREVKGTVARRGPCGDVFLIGEPNGARIVDVKIATSYRRREITFSAAALGLSRNTGYALRADVTDHGRFVRRFVSRRFTADDVRDGRLAFTARWIPPKLWDLNTPQNLYSAQLTLMQRGAPESSTEQVKDVAHPVTFGYREFWIAGRDFYLNGSRIYLSSVPLDNAQVGAAWASYAGARESLERLKSFGINFVYTHNYDCQPGSHLSFAEILRAADDAGVLVSLSQPHFSDYDWKPPDADRTNGYAHHADFYVGVAGNHPSVVAYAMSHNACSYDEAKNPDRIDGIQDSRDAWAQDNAGKALRAEAIVRGLDPTRVVYHHSSGNLGAMYTENFYVNFTPRQELSDWFEHWATKGVKPLFLCEYGCPFSWDWTMYRGWFKGQREWGSARVPWELCVAEWNAQFVGDRAYKISEREKADLRWEAEQFRSRQGWYRWDYPTPVGSSAFDERNEVFAAYIEDNWRAFRTWGVSAISPWEYEVYWQPRPGIDRRRKELPVEWAHLQRPGYSPDYIDSQYENPAVAYERSDWIPSEAARTLIGNNGPILAYIGGKPARFTSKDHNFRAGEIVEKQLIVINNSRRTVSCDCAWSLGLPHRVTGIAHLQVATGDQARVPIRFRLPSTLAAGRYPLNAKAKFSSGEVQKDAFRIDVVPAVEPVRINSRIALFDPKGETRALLDSLGVTYRPVDATADLSAVDVLVIGKCAVTLGDPMPDVRRVRDGLKVIVFEQTAEALERRLGFRTAEYGLRQLFERVPDHPLLAALSPESLRDWRGEATLSTPRLQYMLRPRYGPTVKWCGIEVPRVWRSGCQGNVASVLIEKPPHGDFLTILDGGYSLQYAPLMQFREGQGMALFCQVDVTGRTESDPAADRLVRNILQYVSAWKPAPRRKAMYAGDPAGKAHLEACGFSFIPPTDGGVKDAVLIAGPGSDKDLTRGTIARRLDAGGRVLAVGMSQPEADSLLPMKVEMRAEEHIAAYFAAGEIGSWREGIGPADVHNRDPQKVPLVTGGAEVAGNGVIAAARDSHLVFCQLVPWRFDANKQMNLKRTFRRTSCLLTRLAANMGVGASSPLLDDFHRPVASGDERRWLDGLYLDKPEEWDDPYRFFGW